MEKMRRAESLTWVKAVRIAMVIVLLFRNFFITPWGVRRESLMPNLPDGEHSILCPTSEINRFDDIDIEAPDTNDNYVKRVIGLPGDTVEIRNEQLIINGENYEEPYLDEYKEVLSEGFTLTEDFTLETLTGEEKVPEGKFFVLGDN